MDPTSYLQYVSQENKAWVANLSPKEIGSILNNIAVVHFNSTKKA